MSWSAENMGRGRWLRWIGGALLCLALVQSITITPSIQGRVVDEQTGEPLSDVSIAALWNLERTTLIDSSLPGGPLKVAETTTHRDGEFVFPSAVLIHWPLAPFSYYIRSRSEMPTLVFAKSEYQVLTLGNDTSGVRGRRHGAGFLSLRSSSLENELVRLARWSVESDDQVDNRTRLALQDIERAVARCSRRWVCQEQSLQRVQDVLLRSRPGAASPSN